MEQIKEIIQGFASLQIDAKIDAINEVKRMLHEVSPFKNEPVDMVLWVKNGTVSANDYNPNSVAPPEMKLLQISIEEDGYTQPIVTFLENPITTERTVVDGFHRNRVGKESDIIKRRIHGYLPVVTINEDRTDKSDRIASTIRHNRARGKHGVDSMSEIVVELKRRNWSDEKIARQLGMDADEILRLSQISGLAEMFQDQEFSDAWKVVDGDEIDQTDDLSEIEE